MTEAELTKLKADIQSEMEKKYFYTAIDYGDRIRTWVKEHVKSGAIGHRSKDISHQTVYVEADITQSQYNQIIKKKMSPRYEAARRLLEAMGRIMDRRKDIGKIRRFTQREG